MANYYATARTNYFRVKDLDAFRKAVALANVEIVEEIFFDENNRRNVPTGRVALLSEQPDGAGWTTWAYDEDTDEEIEIKIDEIVCAHLDDGEIAYGMEVGAEKMCYLVGTAWATNGRDIIYAHLENQIRTDIADIFDVEDMSAVSHAEY